MNLRYLLDTSLVSAAVSRHPDPKVLSQLQRYDTVCAIAAPVWHELTFGCYRLPAGRKREILEDFLSSVVRATMPILPYDEAAAAWHGREHARLTAQGQTPPFVDGQIAAVACVQDLVLVTLNDKDFRVFSGLKIENWSN